MNTRAVHLELGVDYSTCAETILCYQRTTYAVLYGYGYGSQLVGVERELRESLKNLAPKKE